MAGTKPSEVLRAEIGADRLALPLPVGAASAAVAEQRPQNALLEGGLAEVLPIVDEHRFDERGARHINENAVAERADDDRLLVDLAGDGGERVSDETEKGLVATALVGGRHAGG